MRSRIAVLVSGRGSNLQALLDHLDRLGDARTSDVVVVISNRTGAGALEIARQRDIAAEHVARPEDGAGMLALLARHRVDLVVLAGYLKRVPAEVIREYQGRVLNVHPALLPSFGGEGMYGARVHEAVVAAGERETGVTIHLVDDEYDRGSIVAQWRIPVAAGENAQSIAGRVLELEHFIYPRTIEMVAALTMRATRTSA
ncbi:MAG TPA: phosphoribosylglycinamide formyltransferase [Gemmatimonadaceae bacterium]|nr:phosphoribosylglycinamide formyltransferase [Gemmatimonadaceae bacterium]